MPKPNPKTEIDYSTTIIYKITCKDPDIKDVYVGHTTNFVKRRQAHKQGCVNNHACKLYAIIRKHGGWKNWIMEIVHFFTCNNQYEARTKEQEYFVLLNATLNSIEPMSKPKLSAIEMSENTTKLAVNESISKKYYCNGCLTGTNNKKDFHKHLSSYKHTKYASLSNCEQKVAQLLPEHKCINCEKVYKSRTGLWYHLKMCKHLNDSPNSSVSDKKLIMLLVKENAELKNMLVEEYKSTHQMMIEVVKNVTNKCCK